MENNKSNYVTRTHEEDMLVVSMTSNLPVMTIFRYFIFIVMSVIILGTYLFMNRQFYPGYPVINAFAEKDESFDEHYPPFRMNEWINYSITSDLISKNAPDEDSLSRKYSIGFSILAVPLTKILYEREALYYSLCGLAIGLNFFVQPHMTLPVVLFAVIIFAERSRWTWKNPGILFLWGGFCISIAAFFAIHAIVLGGNPENILSYFSFMHNQPPPNPGYTRGNFIVGILKFLFDNPHGLFFIMPVTMIVPMGIILMLRKKLRSAAIITGTLILYVILYAALKISQITGETVGSRQLLPIIPLLVIPLPFMWEEGTGEKIWLGITLLLTVYLCSFGWWAGVSHEEGFFNGILQDRNARYIMLARKDKLARPAFKSSNEIAEQFFDALKKRDMKKWLQTLDRTSINRIGGFERVVFNILAEKIISQDISKNDVIESVDPDNGVRLIIPEIDIVDIPGINNVMP